MLLGLSGEGRYVVIGLASTPTADAYGNGNIVSAPALELIHCESHSAAWFEELGKQQEPFFVFGRGRK
jgi:hypothetical protein